MSRECDSWLLHAFLIQHPCEGGVGRDCVTSHVRDKEAEREREMARPRILTPCTPGALLGVRYCGIWSECFPVPSRVIFQVALMEL